MHKTIHHHSIKVMNYTEKNRIQNIETHNNT